jgi:hypothetical protein
MKTNDIYRHLRLETLYRSLKIRKYPEQKGLWWQNHGKFIFFFRRALASTLYGKLRPPCWKETQDLELYGLSRKPKRRVDSMTLFFARRKAGIRREWRLGWIRARSELGWRHRVRIRYIKRVVASVGISNFDFLGLKNHIIGKCIINISTFKLYWTWRSRKVQWWF